MYFSFFGGKVVILFWEFPTFVPIPPSPLPILTMDYVCWMLFGGSVGNSYRMAVFYFWGWPAGEYNSCREKKVSLELIWIQWFPVIFFFVPYNWRSPWWDEIWGGELVPYHERYISIPNSQNSITLTLEYLSSNIQDETHQPTEG